MDIRPTDMQITTLKAAEPERTGGGGSRHGLQSRQLRNKRGDNGNNKREQEKPAQNHIIDISI